ncbi:NosR/NirI family protein [Belnapia rosea]|uniref:NosR/NirI family protein n=1 Tax=Belnapia rosea TaxID=938405 RepID=UPI00088ED925|nr:NosR/NirI family protein [Belnapia rosea]SDB74327.1 NosR/NirI family transcriptional regulator, nitrous oxide reductase regulator [Belnapia rosea]
MLLAIWAAPADAARLTEFLPRVSPGDIFPGADRLGPPEGEPPLAAAYAGDRLLGHVWLTTDVTDATGYSGKPIQMLVAADTSGVIRGLRLMDHKEPIVLIGIPERRIIEPMNRLVGAAIGPIARGQERPPQVDIVSGATVTMLVMADSIVRSAVRLQRAGRLGAAAVASGGATAAAPAPAAPLPATLIPGPGEIRDWESLLGDGSVRRLHLSIGEVNEAFARSGNADAAASPELGDPDETFINLYAALVSAPTIGRSLLGDAGYEQLAARLRPGQQAILVAGEGIYSFKGSGYVRGGIFDRIELLQDGRSLRFRDRDHRRLGDIAAAGAPTLPEIALFVMPESFGLDPTAPWQLQLLVQRATGVREKAFLGFELGYRLPDQYINRPPLPAPATAVASPAEAFEGPLEEPLWQQIWRAKTWDIGITAVALLILTGIFFFQDQLVRRPALYRWVRRGFLLWTLVWLGWYANAQLSIVNVLTFSNSLLTGFNWDYFLTAPLIFILWGGVAAALIFWGRGVFCGWLCPFGALQELLATIAQALKVPQITLPWGLHERLWPIKYVIFLGLFGLSLHSVALAEQMAEVEPFKTAIILKFMREWPFTLYAVGLLLAGLFVERFFCRYLCPLGAALAIPGRMRTFEWLKRWSECGSPCQRCARECPVQSIHPEGNINPNECIYCMHCQELYRAEDRCPHNIQKRLKREKQIAMSAIPLPGGRGPKTIITRNGKPAGDAPAVAPGP